MEPLPDHETETRIRSLRQRAGSLRSQASCLPVVLDQTYRRRAQELELEAFLLEQRDVARRSLV
jgi:hypothetical protein